MWNQRHVLQVLRSRAVSSRNFQKKGEKIKKTPQNWRKRDSNEPLSPAGLNFLQFELGRRLQSTQRGCRSSAKFNNSSIVIGSVTTSVVLSRSFSIGLGKVLVSNSEGWVLRRDRFKLIRGSYVSIQRFHYYKIYQNVSTKIKTTKFVQSISNTKNRPREVCLSTQPTNPTIF